MGPTGGIMTSLDEWDWKTDAPEFTPQVGSGPMPSSPPSGPPPPPPPSSQQVPMPSFVVPQSSGQLVTPVLVAGLGAPATWGNSVPAQGGWGDSKPLGQLPAQSGNQGDQMYSAFAQGRGADFGPVQTQMSPRMGMQPQMGMQGQFEPPQQGMMNQNQGMMNQNQVRMQPVLGQMPAQLSPMSGQQVPSMQPMPGQMSPMGNMGGTMQPVSGQMQLQPMNNGQFVEPMGGGGSFVQPGFVSNPGFVQPMGGTFVAVPANPPMPSLPDGMGLQQNINDAQKAARQRQDQQQPPPSPENRQADRERDITSAQLQARQRVFGNAPDLIADYLREHGGRASLMALSRKLEGQVRKASGKAVKEVIDGCDDLFTKMREGKVCLRGFECEEDEPRQELCSVQKAFDPTSRTYGELSLVPGELVLLQERTPSGWCRGTKVKHKLSGPTSGWFPLASVAHLGRPLADARMSLLEEASSQLVRINAKQGRLSIDLSGFLPPLNDTDVAKFATWLAPRLTSLKGKDYAAEVSLARNAVGDRGVDILLQVLLRQDMPVEKLDLRANEVGAEGLAAICSYIQTTSLGCVKELLLDENPLDRSCTARLFECLHQHPAYRGRSDTDSPVWLHPGSHELETPARILARTRGEYGVKVSLEEANISTLASSWRRERR